MANLITRVFGNLNTNYDLEKMKEFERSHPNLGTASNAFKELLDSVENNGIFITYLNYSELKTRFTS